MTDLAVGYTRVSTTNQTGPDSFSLAAQKAVIQEMASTRNLAVGAIFTDVASGSSDKREGLSLLLSALDNPQVKFLLVYRLNRLARNLRLLLTIVHMCVINSVQIISQMESDFFTNTATGKLQLSAYGAIAELEREMTRENQRNALKEKRRQGEVLSENVAFGYKYDAVSKHAVISAVDAEVVRWLYQRYTTMDEGYRLLTIACNDHFGMNLKQPHVGRILRNGRYAGKDINYPAIISQKLFAKAEAKRKARGAVKTHNESWLHGKLVCPICRKKLLVNTVTRRGKRVRYYACRQEGHTFSVKATVVEQLVLGQLEQLVKVKSLKLAISRGIEASSVHNSSRVLPDVKELLGKLEAGQISSAMYIKQKGDIERSTKQFRQQAENQEQAIAKVIQAFKNDDSLKGEVWNRLLGRIEFDESKLVTGIFLAAWPTDNLLKGENEFGEYD
ncbi:recombinase family protein [Levilactobacillus yiduensis]|uniref:recombinase family protein n=1 Tax=Levilactobacillus yiduensis TaxID=2953880 RepID=UPI001AD835F8|nr:recombinase family protein [Levilactobacillus yiduensis]